MNLPKPPTFLDFTSMDLFEHSLKAAVETGAAVAAVPVKDTIKLVNSNRLIKETLQRDKLWAVQTPQVFTFDIIAEAYRELTTVVTDDAAANVVAQFIGRVCLINQATTKIWR